MQTTLARHEIATGTAIVTFSQTLTAAVTLALAQTAFTGLLRHGLSIYAPSVNQEAVLAAGATNYVSVIPASARPAVLAAYNYAITHTYFLSAAMAAVTVFTALGMGWTSVKKKVEKG